MVFQAISLLGALLVLGGYVALQRGRLASGDRLFNLPNFVGAGLLMWVAVEDRRTGFIPLEGAWALLSLPGAIRGRGTRAQGRGCAAEGRGVWREGRVGLYADGWLPDAELLPPLPSAGRQANWARRQ